MADYQTLNKDQVAAITHGDGPLLIIAGAGTGKTTVITQRIQHLILEKNVSPEHILALTFTEKAALEMEERIDIALPYGYTQMWIATFHSFCDRILRQDAIHIGLPSNYKMLTEAQSVLFLQKNLFNLNLDYFRPLGNPTKFLQGLLQHFSRLKDEDINPQEYEAYVKKRFPQQPETPEEKEEQRKLQELAAAYKAYEELKIKENVMDFGDLITNTLKLFRLRPNILKQYQDQFQYILIDEFQDTNFAQNQLALLLSGKRQNITVVGDDDQAIYRWRGAAISNMIQFRTHFPSAKIVTLTKNYRSSAAILDTAYQVIQHNNPDRLEVKEHIDKKLTAERKVKGNKVSLLLGDRGENEAELTVNTILNLMSKHSYSYKDFAILVRANDHAQPFIRTLERYKLPFQFLGPGQLFHQEEIKDLIAYMKVLYNFEDSSSLYRVLTMDIFGISAMDIATLLNVAKNIHVPLFEVLKMVDKTEISEDGKNKCNMLFTMISKHLELVPKETAGQILYYFLEESGLLNTYLQTNSSKEELKAQNIAKFFEKLKSFENQNEDASVFAIVDWIDLSMEMGESPLAAQGDWSENNAINILTIHSSKGLEFPVVFVTNLVAQRFPSRERREQIPLDEGIIKEVLPEGDYHLQEERRLFYVAMTRAKDLLFLTAAKLYGEAKRERKISPFVIEAIGQQEVDQVLSQLKAEKKQLPLIEMFPSEEETKPTIALPNLGITYLSYSQIQTFDICPLHYKLRYILKVPTHQSASQSYGTSIHSVLREFYMKHIEGESVDVNSIEEILRNNWIVEGYTNREHEEQAFQQAIFIIKRFIKSNFNPTYLPIGLEVPFQFTIGKVRVGGRIDRIDRVDEKTLEIIDYKTGGTQYDEKSIKNNFQLTLYGLAASEIRDPLYHRQPEELLLSIYALEENKKYTTRRSREDLEKAKNTLLDKAQEIATSPFQCSGSIFCQNCEYKMLCKTLS